MSEKKEKKELVGLIVVLAWLLICLLLFLVFLFKSPSETPAEPSTVPTTAAATSAPATVPTTAPTEATTEPTTEPTEETQPQGNATPGGAGGYNPGGGFESDDEDEEEEKEEEKVTVGDPGTVSNPYMECVTQLPAQFRTVTVPAGQSVTYAIHGALGQIIHVDESGVTLTYQEKTVTPGEDGKTVVTADRALNNVPVLVTLNNTAEADKAFTVYVDPGYGSQERPYELPLGQFDTVVMESDTDGVFYTYTAQKAGVLRVQCKAAAEGIAYEYLFYNKTTGEVRTMTADGIADEAGVKTLSIGVAPGDVVLMAVDVLPDGEKKEAGARFTSVTAFDAGASAPQQGAKRISYTVAVKDADGTAIPGVPVAFKAGGLIIDLTTNANGEAAVSLPVGSYSLTVTAPEGYTEDATVYAYTENTTHLDITFSKKAEQVPTVPTTPSDPDDPTTPTEPNQPTTPPEEEIPADFDGVYTVTITDDTGAAQSGIVVQFWKDGAQAGMQMVDGNGVATATLTPGTYTVKLAFSGTAKPYEEKTAKVTAKMPDLHIRLATTPLGKSADLGSGKAYEVSVGSTYVTLQADANNYFLFTPTESGVYRFASTDPDAKISYWGSKFFLNDATSSTDYTEAANAFTQNVKETHLGGTFVIGLTGDKDAILEITRVGDAILDETDMEAQVYVAKQIPSSSNASSGTPSYVDLTSAAAAVLGADGYYHLNNADGPVLYMNLGEDAPYVSMWKMLGFTGFGGTSLNKVFRDANGVATHKEDYTACMMDYVECISPSRPYYPLTEDLVYMVQNGGEYKGWWDSSNGNYLFADLPNLNTATA